MTTQPQTEAERKFHDALSAFLRKVEELVNVGKIGDAREMVALLGAKLVLDTARSRSPLH